MGGTEGGRAEIMRMGGMVGGREPERSRVTS